jgi:hypothetical protein
MPEPAPDPTRSGARVVNGLIYGAAFGVGLGWIAGSVLAPAQASPWQLPAAFGALGVACGLVWALMPYLRKRSDPFR